MVYQLSQDQINQLLIVAAHGKNNFLRRKFGCWTQRIHSTGSLISVISGGLFDTAFLVSVEQQVCITLIQMTLDVSTDVVEEVLHSSTCRPWHDHSTAHPSKNEASTSACLRSISTFRVFLRTAFVFATFMAPLSSNIYAGRDASSCAIRFRVS